MSGNGTVVPRSVRYRGPDRRFRTVGITRLRGKRVASATVMVVVAAGSPATLLVLKHPSAATVTSYLLVASGLASVAAGGVRLVSWRMIGHALHGWLGSAFVVLGILILITTGLSGAGVRSLPSVAPADALLNSLVAGFLVWRGLTCDEVEAGFSPLVAVECGVGAALSVAALWVGLQTNGVLPAVASGAAARSFLYALSGVVWVSLAVLARRLHSSVRPTALAVGFVGIGLLVRAGGSSSWGVTLASSVPIFLGMSFAFGTALARLDAVLSSDDRRHRRLQQKLDASRRKVESDRQAAEAWLHDLRNAVAALQAADTVLRSAPDGWLEARAVMADSVTAELAWLHSLVESARQLRPMALDLESTLEPVVVAERLLGADVRVDIAGVTVLADRVALNRVVQNVLANARHYAPHGPVEIAATARGRFVEVAIRDHGAGVPPAERAAIFQRGVRGSSSAATTGSGLGLYVARSLVESMGGTISVRNAEPGACFVFTVPRADDDRRAADDTELSLEEAGHLARAL